ncbi:MAG: hypothetical protein HKN33_15735 [Pyrinomonadaceae bacterium]|nr:hypothetical protein [Pyrinomonadaceae bacterium]
MKKHLYSAMTATICVAIGVLVVWFVWLVTAQFNAREQATGNFESGKQLLESDGRSLSGPYTHKNLTIFLVHGKNMLKGRTAVPLEQALEKRFARVYETSNVEELEIENLSEKDEIYVQAGDIVKGGNQDRILNADLVIPAKSGRIPIGSFCVEAGRWSRRGNESSSNFGSSKDYASSKDLKVAAKVARSQQEVWDEVSKTQDKLSDATNSAAKDERSATSLQLTLEKKEVREHTLDYMRAVGSAIDGKSDVIGFVFSVNGEISGGETYGSNALFLRLWPKLLRASAVEAVSRSVEDPDQNATTNEDVREFIRGAENSKLQESRRITDRISMRLHESNKAVYTESTDRGSFLHGSYILK